MEKSRENVRKNDFESRVEKSGAKMEETGPWQKKGSRTLDFYHFSSHAKVYEKIKHLLNVLATRLLKDQKAIVQTIRDLVSVGIDYDNASIGNLADYVFTLKYGELEEFIYNTLPRIASLCLEAEALFPESDRILILETGKEREITLTRLQILSLLSLSFFGLIPATVSDDLPLNNMICGVFYTSKKNNHMKMKKLPFIFSYFTQAIKKLRDGDEDLNASITFLRRNYSHPLSQTLTYWQSLVDKKMGEIEVNDTDKIEDFPNTIRTDFANK